MFFKICFLGKNKNISSNQQINKMIKIIIIKLNESILIEIN